MDINVIFQRISIARAFFSSSFLMFLIRHEFTTTTRIAKINTQQ